MSTDEKGRLSVTVNDLPIRTRVEAIYAGTKELLQFSKDNIFPLLESLQRLGNINAREAAILICYYRMHNWIDSMVCLNYDRHYQATAVAARALLELAVDLIILSEDKTGKEIEKFFAFQEVDTFNSAEKLVEFIATHPDCEEEEDSFRKEYFGRAGLKDRIDKIALKLWGKSASKRKHLNHWSGLPLPDRIKKLDKKLQAMYYRHYKYLSWYVHSGSQGHANMPQDALINLYAYSHILAQQIFIEAIHICCQEFKIDRAIDNFSMKIENARESIGRFLLGEIVNYLKTNMPQSN